jgi:hypothetical protein
MSQTTEERFLDYIKQADSPADATVYPDPAGIPPENTEAVRFSDVAQESSKDVREGVADRLLPMKSQSDAAERALVGYILPRGETSSIQLKSVEKVSFPRSQTLMEQTVGKLGFL